MKDTTVFEGKSFTELMKDIHTATLDKRGIIRDILSELRQMITDKETAAVIAPLVRDYLETLIKNDDQLTKMATIVQRMIASEAYSKSGGENGEFLSEREKEQLFRELKEETKALEKKLDEMPKPTDVQT